VVAQTVLGPRYARTVWNAVDSLRFIVRFVPSKQAAMPGDDGEGDNFFTT
jgi:hypothetical protein